MKLVRYRQGPAATNPCTRPTTQWRPSSDAI